MRSKEHVDFASWFPQNWTLIGARSMPRFPAIRLDQVCAWRLSIGPNGMTICAQTHFGQRKSERYRLVAATEPRCICLVARKTTLHLRVPDSPDDMNAAQKNGCVV